MDMALIESFLNGVAQGHHAVPVCRSEGLFVSHHVTFQGIHTILCQKYRADCDCDQWKTRQKWSWWQRFFGVPARGERCHHRLVCSARLPISTEHYKHICQFCGNHIKEGELAIAAEGTRDEVDYDANVQRKSRSFGFHVACALAGDRTHPDRIAIWKLSQETAKRLWDDS